MMIDLGLSTSIADDDTTALKRAQAALIRVFDVTTGMSLGDVRLESASGGTLSLTVPVLNEGDTISIVILKLTFDGKEAKNPLAITTTVPRTGQKTEETQSSSGLLSPGHWIGAKGKDDSNVYIATQINTAIDADPSYGIDAKLDVPFRRFMTGRRIQNTGLTFSTQISDAPEADPDSMEFGAYWRTFIWDCGSRCGTGVWFRRLQWRNTLQSESNKDFSNTNIIWPTALRLISKTWGSSSEFGIRPYIGNEFGFNLNSPVPELQNRLIDRPLIGLNALLLVPTDIGILKSLNWETLYEGRWPLRNELALQENGDGALKFMDFGTAPRDYVNSSLTAGFGTYFGLTFSYEYGQLPPSFKLVDNAFRVEITFKAKRTGGE
ncbi:MAG TPA: hypothetical protein VH596_08620 [Terriglobales bacterium]